MVEPQHATPPNRHMMAFLTFIALIPLVYYIPPWVEQYVTTNHFYVTVLSLVIIVPIVSYLALPLLVGLRNVK